MCKIISSDAVIGNFILESVERNNFSISIEKMISYDEELSQKLRAYDYFTRFDFDEIIDFRDNYPFFVKSVESNYIKILDETEDTRKLINQLKRHFRVGMPTLVINEMISVSKSIFDLG